MVPHGSGAGSRRASEPSESKVLQPSHAIGLRCYNTAFLLDNVKELCSGGQTALRFLRPHSIGRALSPVNRLGRFFFASPVAPVVFSSLGAPLRTAACCVPYYNAGTMPSRANYLPRKCKCMKPLRNFLRSFFAVLQVPITIGNVQPAVIARFCRL
jgi:hypothetical protein